MVAPLTDGSDREVVALLAQHAASLEEVRQAPVRFVVETWQRWLKGVDPDVLSILEEVDGSVSREDLRARAQETHPQSEANLFRLFLLTMAWGRGRRNARMLPGFQRAFGDPCLVSTLRVSMKKVRLGLPAEGYDSWLKSQIPGIGESFFTKWLFVAGSSGVPEGSLTPLVLDNRVWASLRLLGWSSWKVSGGTRSRYRASAYCSYLASLRTWSTMLRTQGVAASPEAIEVLLFNGLSLVSGAS